MALVKFLPSRQKRFKKFLTFLRRAARGVRQHAGPSPVPNSLPPDRPLTQGARYLRFCREPINRRASQSAATAQ